ncbi:MAG: hypothetical protein M5U34_01370 [Chloroflexi bacterium]|nr:hypothetical protein [Chloroflexota bacterium]
MEWSRSDPGAGRFRQSFDLYQQRRLCLGWQDAGQLVIDGDAAFNVMGDWQEGGSSVSLGSVPQEGYTWAAVPGTEGNFQFLSDSFVLPVGAPIVTLPLPG